MVQGAVTLTVDFGIVGFRALGLGFGGLGLRAGGMRSVVG